MFLKEKILFSKEECESIIWNETKNIKHHTNISNRKYYSQHIYYDDGTRWLFLKMKEFFESETGLKIIKIREQIHFHRFIEKDWFGKHNDIRHNRLYAVGVVLNDKFEGGDFKLYNPNEVILNKEVGNTYLFDVKIYHEITPILNGERYSLLWFLENEHIGIVKDKLI